MAQGHRPAGIDKYRKAANHRPAKQIAGTNKVILASTTVKGPNQMRCPKCYNMMGATRAANGTPVMQCKCGNTVTMRAL